MKILEKKYPMGSLPYQKSDGRYIDDKLYSNLQILARKITDNQNWVGVISSSTLENGTGKSVLASQIMEAYFDLVNQYHGTNLDISMQNVVFKPQELIERAFKVPRYSGIILDEWEDAHYWSELGVTLRQFFRKCRQLNLFIILIIPNFFQLPINYAISRSVFFIDVRFEGEFERGHFRFYSFDKKKDLYVRGKKTMDYGVVNYDFRGTFGDGYAYNKQEYDKAKLKDMIDDHEQKKVKTEKQILRKIYYDVYTKLKRQEVTLASLASAFNITRQTGMEWIKMVRDGKNDNDECRSKDVSNNITIGYESDDEFGGLDECPTEDNINSQPAPKINK